MKLFVWNDRRWKLVDENEEYDKENYFVVHKLFVRWLKSSEDTVRTNASIGKAFEKFGKVKAVENVTGRRFRAKPDVHEAYVTFHRSEDAYNAFVANRTGTESSELITVLPIDTWKLAPVRSLKDELEQLSYRIEEVDDVEDPRFVYRMSITPGMLLRVFRSFLRVSKTFLDGLDLLYELNDSDDDESTDDESEESEETEGTEGAITEEATESDDDSTDSEGEDDPDEELDCLSNHEFEKRISEVILKNLGYTELEMTTLSIRKKYISGEMLEWFAPVLKYVRKLTFHIDADCNILYALPGYCPIAQSFHFEGKKWAGEFEQVPAVAWPSLKELFLNISTCSDEGKRKLHEFIQMNKQLLSLQLELLVDLDFLAMIGKSLVALNSLAFVRNNFEGLNVVLDSLAGLTEMRGLKITALNVEKNHLNGLVKCAKRLRRLQNLQLITLFLNCESESEVDKDFEHLKEFCITHHCNCKCHGPNRVLSFREKNVEVPEESAVLVMIVNTKPPVDSIDKTMETEIMATFKKTTKFFPNIIEHIELPEANNHIYMQISSAR